MRGLRSAWSERIPHGPNQSQGKLVTEHALWFTFSVLKGEGRMMLANGPTLLASEILLFELGCEHEPFEAGQGR